MECFGYKRGCGVRVSRHLHVKKELIWAVDEWFWLIAIVLLFKPGKIKSKVVLSFDNIIVCIAM